MTSPVVRCLAEQQSETEIHYVTKEKYAGIVKSNPNISKVYTIVKSINEISSKLKKENYDFVVDLHNNLRTSFLKKQLGIESSSFPKLNYQKFLLTKFGINKLPNSHIVDRYFQAVKDLSVKNDFKGLDYFISKDDKVNVKDYSIQEPFYVFAIGSQFETKKLPEQKIIEILQKTKKLVVLLGGKEDQAVSKKLQGACPNTIDLCGLLNLNQSASVIQQSEKVITHDTGLMHIAAAFKKPIISIWGNTIPEFGMYPYMPNNNNLYSIHQVDGLKCRPCSKIGYDKCPKGHFQCMKLQNVNGIVEKINH